MFQEVWSDCVIFYDSNVASVELNGRKYILTVGGDYNFTYKNKDYDNGNFDEIIDELTDDNIKEIDSNGDMRQWGCFTIELWENNKLIYTLDNYPVTYDEAIDVYIKCVDNDFKLMERLDKALEKADDTFWSSIAESFPEAKSGDIDPLILRTFKKTMKVTVEHWVLNNVTIYE